MGAERFRNHEIRLKPAFPVACRVLEVPLSSRIFVITNFTGELNFQVLAG